MVKCLPTTWETRDQSLGWEDPLEKEMATHSSVLAWRIPWMEEPGRLWSMGSQRVGHDWATSLSLSQHTRSDLITYCYITKYLLDYSLIQHLLCYELNTLGWKSVRPYFSDSLAPSAINDVTQWCPIDLMTVWSFHESLMSWKGQLEAGHGGMGSPASLLIDPRTSLLDLFSWIVSYFLTTLQLRSRWYMADVSRWYKAETVSPLWS